MLEPHDIRNMALNDMETSAQSTMVGLNDIGNMVPTDCWNIIPNDIVNIGQSYQVLLDDLSNSV